MDSPSGPGPPEWMRTCEPSLADGARTHVFEIQKKRSSYFSIFSIARKEDKDTGKVKNKPVLPTPPAEAEPVLIEFRDKRINKEDEGHLDQFKWAFLYENQRGITIFSTAYYSSRSLLPHDPPPFTVPDSGESSPNQPLNHSLPNVTLTTYPLPDPTWRWVSKSWLVDMRGDGDVQYDGFEYNWFFRRHGWIPKVGWCGAGGYVRRRRWVRLMMRPSDARLQAEADVEAKCEDEANMSESYDEHSEDTIVWKGDKDDWSRVRKALKSLARDGLKLDLWADWLSDLIGDSIFTPLRLRGDDSTGSTPDTLPKVVAYSTSKSHEHPPREWILTILREHGRELRGCFIYPDSRAHLRDLFVMAGLMQNTFLEDFTPGPYMPPSTTDVSHFASSQLLGPGDFWSRSSGLAIAGSMTDMLQQKDEVDNAGVS